jgi:hypothetical protein
MWHSQIRIRHHERDWEPGSDRFLPERAFWPRPVFRSGDSPCRGPSALGNRVYETCAGHVRSGNGLASPTQLPQRPDSALMGGGRPSLHGPLAVSDSHYANVTVGTSEARHMRPEREIKIRKLRLTAWERNPRTPFA